MLLLSSSLRAYPADPISKNERKDGISFVETTAARRRGQNCPPISSSTKRSVAEKVVTVHTFSKIKCDRMELEFSF